MMLTSSWNTTYQWSFLIIILDDSIVDGVINQLVPPSCAGGPS